MSKPLTGETTCRRGMDLWSYIFAIKILLLERPLAEGKGGCRNVWCGEANKTPKTKTKTDTKRKFTQNNRQQNKLGFLLCLVVFGCFVEESFFCKIYSAIWSPLLEETTCRRDGNVCVCVCLEKNIFPTTKPGKANNKLGRQGDSDWRPSDLGFGSFFGWTTGEEIYFFHSEEEKGRVHLQSHFNTNQNGKGKKNCSIG